MCSISLLCVVLLVAAGDSSPRLGQGAGPAPLPPGGAGGRAVWSDDFNRSSGTNMGADWDEFQGDMFIDADAALGGAGVWSAMWYEGVKLNYEAVRLVVQLETPEPNGHVGLIMGGRKGSQEWLYTRIADTDGDSQYDQIFFSKRGTNSGWGLATRTIPVPNDLMRVSSYITGGGNTLNLDVDLGANGSIEYTFSNNGILNLSFTPGLELGIATQGACRFDDWQVFGPDGPTMTIANLLSGQRAEVNYSNVSPNNLVHLMFSLTGNGPTSSQFGNLVLSAPITVMSPVLSRPDGTAYQWLSVPAGAKGRNVWFHALDYGTETLSNPLAMTIG